MEAQKTTRTSKIKTCRNSNWEETLHPLMPKETRKRRRRVSPKRGDLMSQSMSYRPKYLELVGRQVKMEHRKGSRHMMMVRMLLLMISWKKRRRS
jgi:hypothetical protein